MARMTTIYRLVLVGGDLDVEEIELQSTLMFGRGLDADVRLNHPLVSRQHCRLHLRHDQIVVCDLGSLNGTYVGSQRLEPHIDAVLPPDGLLSVGTVTFRAVYASEEVCEDRPRVDPVHDSKSGIDTAVAIDETVRNPGDNSS